ncbi:CBS domain-containing protein [Anaeromyxobacter paludicola]|uniref:CBS domain-containing protein n=1 Tax=Anaeromyxobacter paludicola TaxID=2918171 RepID=A0ABM7XE39_9BACT|nr:CBS domain-containing protein [Anaeromyxobacter paludicola]BDG10162.1 CBS domain-containing protein [Anaeromyxobacter paludicola]
MLVQEAMTRQVFACREDEPLSAAAQVMWDRDVGAVPVLGRDGRLAGIVTDRDLCMAAYFAGKALDAVPIETAMCRKVFTAAPDQTIDSAEETMRHSQVRRLPVLDAGGALVGILTLSDLARATAARRAREEETEVAVTLAAIAQPRDLVSLPH